MVKRTEFSIYLLQETHLNSQLSDKWEQEWGNKSFFSGNTKNSQDASILFNKAFVHDIVNYMETIPGRLMAVDIKLDDKIITFVNIYGPNDDTIIFLKSCNSLSLRMRTMIL